MAVIELLGPKTIQTIPNNENGWESHSFPGHLGVAAEVITKLTRQDQHWMAKSWRRVGSLDYHDELLFRSENPLARRYNPHQLFGFHFGGTEGLDLEAMWDLEKIAALRCGQLTMVVGKRPNSRYLDLRCLPINVANVNRVLVKPKVVTPATTRNQKPIEDPNQAIIEIHYQR